MIIDLEVNAPDPMIGTMEDYFKCSKCEFEISSKNGLNIHIRRKDATNESVKFSQNYEECEKEFRSLKDLKNHSYMVAFSLTGEGHISVKLGTSPQRQWTKWRYTFGNVTGQKILNVVFANLLPVY